MITVDSGKAIRIAMASEDIGVEELANRIGVSHPSISSLRHKANCQTATLERVANALGMRPSELLALGESDHHED